MKYDYYIVDVFSSEPFGGNQLAVLPNAKGISSEGMQMIAREFNFAESSFVFPPSNHASTARVRIFTPRAEVDFAGHPTVGTASALVYGGHVKSSEITLEENIGLVTVSIENNKGLLAGTLTNKTALVHPEEKPKIHDLAEILGLELGEVKEGFYASLGLDFCFAHLTSNNAVDASTLNKTAWTALMDSSWSKNLFFFSGDLTHGGKIYARMFAPALGIEEDPATGSAVAALVGVAAKQNGESDRQLNLEITQGVKMGRTSQMKASAQLRAGEIVSASVGGSTVLTASGQIEVPAKWLSSH